MKNHELLDMIGDVNEDYVLAAEGKVVRPPFRWKTLAACAACAALVLGGAYPAYMAAHPDAPSMKNAMALHPYTVVEDAPEEVGEDTAKKAPAEGGAESQPAPPALMAPSAGANADSAPGVAPFVGIFSDNGLDKSATTSGEDVLGSDADSDTIGADDIPVQEAALWYDALLRTMRLDENPEWYGGAWIAGDELLAVAIVDGFRTPELEAQLQEAAGAGAVLQFSTVKYSMEFLNGLLEPASRALEGSGLAAGIGVDVVANCLGVDLYGESRDIPSVVLAALAHLDPDGDAIRVRVFVGSLSTDDELGAKGPFVNVPIATPAPAGQRETPAENGVAPGGVTTPAVSALPQADEEGQPAHYDLLEDDGNS